MNAAVKIAMSIRKDEVNIRESVPAAVTADQPVTNVRIARVKESGHIYLVQYCDHRAKVVYAWTNVISYRGLRMEHEKLTVDSDGEESNTRSWKKFGFDEVELDYLPYTVETVKMLFNQTVSLRKEAGHVLVKRGENTFDVGRGPKAVTHINSKIDKFVTRQSIMPPMRFTRPPVACRAVG
jgi:hypothetical protein